MGLHCCTPQCCMSCTDIYKMLDGLPAVQAFLYGLLQQEEESAALRALAVLTELHRRNVWRDARTVNVIGGCQAVSRRRKHCR